ncbi:hypothetical protein DUI87_30058 [Hirundo rustica rustica]|uniref:BRD3 opposite strand n=1 Tax=Hirundo rustica rustica TaxID=333673 RepID=A0A3M0IX08_HIRRU|nr:hypothetical protein DUI87_30058 [Hirundo rustica rustica]
MSDTVMNGRVPLPEKALSEGYARLRYRDTSLLIWQQQQQKLESAPPNTYLSRSRSMWYSQYGNEAILVRDKNKLDVSRDTGQSKFCSVILPPCVSLSVYNKPALAGELSSLVLPSILAVLGRVLLTWPRTRGMTRERNLSRVLRVLNLLPG